MQLHHQHICINGKKHELGSFLNRASSSSWEDEVYRFIREWYSSDSFIRVQTSGSTGAAKTIQLEKSFVALSAMRTITYFKLQPSDKILHCLPAKYIAGKLMLVRGIIGQLDIHLTDPVNDFNTLGTEDYKFAAMVPNQVTKLLQQKNWNIEQVLVGGDAIPEHLFRKLQNIHTPFYSSYGMTETATHIAIRRINTAKATNYYHCLENITVGLSKQNCLHITMPQLENPPLQTNDIAELLDDKTFRIIGRADNIIISGGSKYSPELLEQKLQGAFNFSFMISWEESEQLGKQLVLLAEIEESAENKSRIQKECKNVLSKFEQPRKLIFVEKLPRTENGKLKRK